MDFSAAIKEVLATKKLLLNQAFKSTAVAKGAMDYVTDCDLAIQKALSVALRKHYPDIPLISEELDNKDVQGDLVFILDPLDGTTNFMHGYGSSCVSLACVKSNEPIFGVVYDPFKEELYVAQKDKGATLNQQSIRVSSVKDISNALIGAETSPYEREDAKMHFDKLLKVFLASMDIRISGSAALDMCYVAAGQTDGFLSRNLRPWDYAAGCCILKEAGGICTNWQGTSPSMKDSSDILASNMLLQEVLHELIR